MLRRIALSGVFTVFGCSERPEHGVRPPRPSVVERALATTIGARLGVPIAAKCSGILGVPTSCVATLPDGMRVPVRIAFVNDVWEFELAEPIITTEPIVAYVVGELADLGIVDHVTCLPQIQRLDPLHPIECALARGGKAFVMLDGTGGIRDLELALDTQSAAARSEELTAARAAELTAMSKRLEHLPDDDDSN